MFSTVVVKRREASQSYSLLAADAAEFGHADDEGECGALAQAGNAEDEIEAAGEIVMAAQRGDDAQQFARASRLQSRDVGHDHAPQPRLGDVFEPDLEAGDVLFNLFDEGQMVSQLRQAFIWLEPHRWSPRKQR
jgi:hypothetical protein